MTISRRGRAVTRKGRKSAKNNRKSKVVVERFDVDEVEDVDEEDEEEEDDEPFYAPAEILSEDAQKSVLNRLSRIIGHLQSIRRMAEAEREIEPMLVQISAVKAALNGVGKEMVRELIQARCRRADAELSSDDVDEIFALVGRYLK